MPGQYGERTCHAARGHRDADRCRARDTAADAGDDDAGKRLGTTSINLFLSTTKDERVAAFEPNNDFTFESMLNQQFVDLGLGDAVMIGIFANVYQERLRPCPLQHFSRNQAIVNNRVGLLNKAHATHGDQVRIPRACTNQINYSTATNHKCVFR